MEELTEADCTVSRCERRTPAGGERGRWRGGWGCCLGRGEAEARRCCRALAPDSGWCQRPYQHRLPVNTERIAHQVRVSLNGEQACSPRAVMLRL